MSEHELNPDELREVIEGPDEMARADALVNLGLYHSREGDFIEAEGCFGSAVDLLTELDKPFPLRHALALLADCQYRQSRYAAAVENYKKVVAQSSDAGDARHKAYAAGALGDALRALDRIDEALEAHRQAAGAFSEIDDPKMVGTNLFPIAENLYRRNQTSSAAEQCLLAYNQFQIAGEPYRAALTKELLADALAAQGEYAEALSHIDDVIGIMNHLEEGGVEQGAKYTKGLILLEAGRHAEAAECLTEANMIFREAGLFVDAAKAELGLLVARFRQDFDESWLISKRSLPRLRAYFDAAGLGVNVAKVDRFLAEWYSLQEAWPKTVRILRHVVTRCQELDEPNLERSTRARLAQALIQIGEYQEASDVLAEVDETLWGDVKSEIEFLRGVRESLATLPKS